MFIIVLLLSILYLKESVMISESNKISFIDDNDIIGSIKIDDINLSNLLLQGLDNKFYFDHNYLKKEDEKGEIFLDFRGDLANNNYPIIYAKNSVFNEINNIKIDSKIEIFYIHENICYKVISNKNTYDLEIRVVDKKNVKKIYGKKIKC